MPKRLRGQEPADSWWNHPTIFRSFLPLNDTSVSGAQWKLARPDIIADIVKLIRSEIIPGRTHAPRFKAPSRWYSRSAPNGAERFPVLFTVVNRGARVSTWSRTEKHVATFPDNEIAKSNELAAAGRQPDTLGLSTCLWKFNAALCWRVTFVIHRVATCYRQLRHTRCLMEWIDIDCKIDDPRGSGS